MKQRGKFGCIDALGNITIFPQFDDAEDFSEGLALFTVNDKHGCIVILGTFPPQVLTNGYDHLGQFFSNFLCSNPR